MRIIRKKSKESKRRSVALFGGAFNPPHKGHVAMVRALLRYKEIDRVWVIPVFRHPFAKGLAPFKARFHMCRLAFSPISNRVTVRRTEEKLGGTSYTVRTLRFLVKRYPGTHFLLVVGADSYKNRSKWKDFKAIERLADIIVFPRGPKSAIPDVSSTGYRAGRQHANSLPAKVAAYIRRHALYSNLGRFNIEVHH